MIGPMMDPKMIQLRIDLWTWPRAVPVIEMMCLPNIDLNDALLIAW